MQSQAARQHSCPGQQFATSFIQLRIGGNSVETAAQPPKQLRAAPTRVT
jgi:hypothetical protein